MADLTERFGTMVFSEDEMKRWLPKDVYKRLAKTIEEGESLDLDVANAVTHAMKEWALLHGATHYAHWFQPLSGITSEKYDKLMNIEATTMVREARRAVDAMEEIVAADYWPVPTYDDILFYVQPLRKGTGTFLRSRAEATARARGRPRLHRPGRRRWR